MNRDHPHMNRANDVAPEEVIKRPKTFGNFNLDDAIIESKLGADFYATFILIRQTSPYTVQK